MWGPGHRMRDDDQEFMAQYPRGKGIKRHRIDLWKRYQECLKYRRETSRTKNYKVKIDDR